MNINKLQIPSNKIKQLENKGLQTIRDILKFLPKSYNDFRSNQRIDDVKPGDTALVIGKLISVKPVYSKNGGICIFANFIDTLSNHKFNAVWFSSPYIKNQLALNLTYAIAGKFDHDNYNVYCQIINPIICTTDISSVQKIKPFYPTIKGMSEDYISKIMNMSLKLDSPDEYLEPDIISKNNLMLEFEAYNEIHNPRCQEFIDAAKKRFIFDDLFKYAFLIKEKSYKSIRQTNIVVNNDSLMTKYIKSLPYNLTADQEKTINELHIGLQSGKTINALIQGDVGCGKTSIALALMCDCVSSGYQAVLMAPTVVVATQHYEGFVDFVVKNNKKIALITSKSCFVNNEKISKPKVVKMISEGAIDFIVGTHSVLSDNIKYPNLGIVVIDEEHKFGVLQKEKLLNSDNAVHLITMSATPIPRSVAMSLYEEMMDIYFIESMPNGRKPVITETTDSDTEVFDKMEYEINKGHQCYMVCRLISPSKSESLKEQDSIEKMLTILEKRFSNRKDIKIGVVTGKMKQSEIDEEMQKFKNNEYQILLATTIVEVGINVPNATLINIRNYEDMGLASLHQLRGRVGRNSLQSYCLLSKSRESDNGRNVLCKTTNGFEISEEDLSLRGMGELTGTKQSGQDVFVMTALAYPQIYAKVKEIVNDIYMSEERINYYSPIIHAD